MERKYYMAFYEGDKLLILTRFRVNRETKICNYEVLNATSNRQEKGSIQVQSDDPKEILQNILTAIEV